MAQRPTFTRHFPEEPFRFAYVNEASVVPELYRTKEIPLLILELLTLVHAVRTGRKGLWVGFCLFSLFVEILGYCGDTHIHGQFNVQLFHFLPLKELLIYPLLMYPSWLVVERIRLPKVWMNACAMAVVNQFANMPYDGFCVRRPFQFTLLVPSFEFSNFDPQQWHGGIAAVYYGWVAMGAASGVAGHFITTRKLTGIQASLTMGASAILSCMFWLPYQTMKAVSCPASPESMDMFTRHLWCIRHATLADDKCWILSITTVALALCYALISERSSASQPKRLVGGEWLILWIARLYFALTVALYAKYDLDMMPVWLTHGLLASFVHRTFYYWRSSGADTHLKAK